MQGGGKTPPRTLGPFVLGSRVYRVEDPFRFALAAFGFQVGGFRLQVARVGDGLTFGYSGGLSILNPKP